MEVLQPATGWAGVLLWGFQLYIPLPKLQKSLRPRAECRARASVIAIISVRYWSPPLTSVLHLHHQYQVFLSTTYSPPQYRNLRLGLSCKSFGACPGVFVGWLLNRCLAMGVQGIYLMSSDFL